ncbi:MAG: pitrilysin family protein [Patescibacteria group bacterium]|mgnify:FL=1
MGKINRIELENGLRIIIAPKPDSLTTTVLILVEAGSKYETKEINGISHFLEHMCFKGTKKRPKSIDIASEFAGIGAINNAFTSLEYTGYYAKAQSKHFDKILDVVSDIYLNQTLPELEINKERGVIIEEINMIEDEPRRKVWDIFLELLYGDQPAGWDTAGTKEVIKKITRDDFIKYRNEHYLPQSTIVVVSGKFDESETMEKIKNYFSSINLGAKSPKIKTKEQQKEPKILLKYKESDQAHMILGVRAYNLFDKRKYALEVLADILGGGMSSRLFQKIREEMGAAYYVRAGADLYTDHGYLAASVGADNKRIEEVIMVCLGEFRKISEKSVDEKELQKSKDHITGNLFISLETSDELASFYGGQEILTKEILSPEEIAKKIQSVKAGEVAEIANDIFKNSKLNLALIGPFEDKAKFESILKL